MPCTQKLFNEKKFKELILYVADKSAEDPSFGATKLNKILFFADFLAYGHLGQAITGAHYLRLERGPAPKELLSVHRGLQAAGDAVFVERKRFGYPQKRIIALRQPDLSDFSAQEIALVDEVIELLKHNSAMEASTLSHLHAVGWNIASDGEEIPYESVFLSTDPLSPSDIKHGRELALKHGWVE